MGACYDVTMKLKFKDNKENEAYDALWNYMQDDHRSNYNFDKFEKEGITTKTLNELIQICLAGWRSTPYDVHSEGNWSCYENSFDASYGWESVLFDMFHVLTPFLQDGSEINIYPDWESSCLMVKNNQCIVIE